MDITIPQPLQSEHDELRALFEQMEGTTDRAVKKRADLLLKIKAGLLPHAKWEEQVFYPAFAERADRDGLKTHAEAVEEHRAVEKTVMPDVHSEDFGTPQFAEIRPDALVEQAFKVTQGSARLQATMIRLQSVTPPLIHRLQAMVAWAGRPERPEVAPGLIFLRKMNMQLASKMRFVSAQLVALLDGDLWLRSARHANAMATRLAAAVRSLPGVRITQDVQANAVFAILDRDVADRLRERFRFYDWDQATGEVRWMCAFDTTEADVDAFAAGIEQSLAGYGVGSSEPAPTSVPTVTSSVG